MRIVILHDQVAADAREDEQDVLVQAEFVRGCLERAGHEVSTLEFGMDMSAPAGALERARPDLVFNLVESMMRSGRMIAVAPTMLDAMGIAYTGCPSHAVWLTSGKLLTKRWLRGAGLPTADWFEQPELGAAPGRAEGSVAPGPWIIKSVWEHASVGLDEDSVIEVPARGGADVLADALARLRARVGGEGFAERYIDGREFNIAMLARPGQPEPEVLPPAEIEFRDFPPERRKVVGFSAKWVADSFAYQHTFREYDFGSADAALLEELRRLAMRCWNEFDLRGYARVDFRIDAERRPWILEINGNPCISPDAGFMAAAERAGMTGDDVVGRIVAAASGAG